MTVEDIEETALVNFTTRCIGLFIATTLLTGVVAAQGYALPDPDGLQLPEESILGPSYVDEGPSAGDSLPLPHSMPSHPAMSAPGLMEPDRLIHDSNAPSAPYDEAGLHEGYHPDGPWHWSPGDPPYGWDGEPAIPESSGTWLSRGVWFMEVDAVAFHRVWNRNNVLYAAADPVVTSPAFGAISQLSTNRYLELSNSHPGEDVAVRFTLGRFLVRDEENRDHVAEFTAFSGGDWVNDVAASAPSANQPLFTPYRVSGSQNRDFSGSTFQRMLYTSRFNSFEANYKVKQRLGRDRMVMDPNGCWRRAAEHGWNRHFLAGLRFLELFENVDWTAQNIITTGTEGRYIVNTRNSLFGAQVGCGIQYATGRWSLGTNSKLGLLINDADARSQLFFSDGTDNFDRFATEDELSFLAEFGLQGRWHFTPNTSLRAGLDLLYFESVALAPHQINFLPVYNNITATGDPVYMGCSLGFECYW